jgi:dTMP kinase
MADGKFIVFEGIDGSGTTTQAQRAAEWLRGQGLTVVETSEPTSGAVGKLIRQALSRKMPGREGEELSPEMFALLFATDRMDHANGKIVPALKRGDWVISDRCYLSSFAYQSVGCDLEWVRVINRYVHYADLTLLLDVDAQVAFDRFAGKRETQEVFESVERMTAIRERYLEIAENLRFEGDRIVNIDAAQSADAVAQEARQVISELL